MVAPAVYGDLHASGSLDVSNRWFRTDSQRNNQTNPLRTSSSSANLLLNTNLYCSSRPLLSACSFVVVRQHDLGHGGPHAGKATVPRYTRYCQRKPTGFLSH